MTFREGGHKGFHQTDAAYLDQESWPRLPAVAQHKTMDEMAVGGFTGPRVKNGVVTRLWGT